MNQNCAVRFAGVFLLLLVGCGGRSDRPTFHQVAGTVTFENHPLGNASVVFVPDDGLMAIGQTDEMGNFALRTNGNPGAVAGPYRVVVMASETGKAIPGLASEEMTAQQRKDASKSVIPEKYGDPKTSNLSATVNPEEKNEFVFALVK